MEKVIIKLCKVNETSEMSLMINDYRIAGIKGGFGNTTIKTWTTNKEDILRAINRS